MNNKEHIIKQTNINTWTIFSEDGVAVNSISKEEIANYCKSAYEYEKENEGAYCITLENIICHTMSEIDKKYLDLVEINRRSEAFSKFLAWVFYVCAESLGNELTLYFKNRLLKYE